MAKNAKAKVANPFCAIRFAVGFHKRVIDKKAGKGSYRRRDKYPSNSFA